jgi:hypothetical protein
VRGLFEEEDSDCEEEEFNEEDGGQSRVDLLGRTLDARPTQRQSGPRVSQPACSRESRYQIAKHSVSQFGTWTAYQCYAGRCCTRRNRGLHNALLSLCVKTQSCVDGKSPIGPVSWCGFARAIYANG